MAKLYNIAKMTTATSGTGTVTLGSAVSGYLSFANAGVQNGDVVTYVLEEGANREIGRGTFTSPDQFSRDTVLKSTAGGTTKITLAGAAQIFISAAAEDIEQAASDTVAGRIEIADQTEMEAASSNVLAVTPGRQHFHPGHPKFWCKVTANSTTINASYNVTSVADTATGRMTVTTANDMATAHWCCLMTVERDTTGAGNTDVLWTFIRNGQQAAGTVQVETVDGAGALNDPAFWHVAGLGDHA